LSPIQELTAEQTLPINNDLLFLSEQSLQIWQPHTAQVTTLLTAANATASLSGWRSTPDRQAVLMVSVEGGEPINVSNLPGEDASISWAPSSRELIFTNSAAGILSQYIVDVDGSALGLLVESGQNGLGSWSP
jgi:hypothetical protein